MLVSKMANQPAIQILKLSADKKTFFNLPTVYQASEQHPLVIRNPKYREFFNKLNGHSKGFLASNGFRNLKFDVVKKGVRTEEASEYLDEQDRFKFKDNLLIAESTAPLDPKSIEFQQPGTYSGMQIMKILSKFDNFGICSI